MCRCRLVIYFMLQRHKVDTEYRHVLQIVSLSHDGIWWTHATETSHQLAGPAAGAAQERARKQENPSLPSLPNRLAKSARVAHATIGPLCQRDSTHGDAWKIKEASGCDTGERIFQIETRDTVTAAL